MTKKIGAAGDEKGNEKAKTAATGKAAPRKVPKKPTVKKYQKYQRPRGGPAKSISDLVPEIGRAAFRRDGMTTHRIDF